MEKAVSDAGERTQGAMDASTLATNIWHEKMKEESKKYIGEAAGVTATMQATVSHASREFQDRWSYTMRSGRS